MNNYQQKQALKLERYSELAEKNKERSEAAYASSKAIANMIPFGQPILVGHHSEARHRRDAKRIHNGFAKSFELADKAEYYANKVKNIENSNVISSDDPEAVGKLKDKLAGLYAYRDTLKEHKKAGVKIESWQFSNLSGNIVTVKKRIAILEARAQSPEVDLEINGTRLWVDKEENRLKIEFTGIPSAEIRQELKSNGFRWSPTNKAWQRQPTRYALDRAKEIIGGTQ